MVLALLKIRQHFLVRPTLIAVSCPPVEIPPVASDIQHGIQHAGSSNDFSPGPAAPFLDHGLAGGVGGFRPAKRIFQNINETSTELVQFTFTRFYFAKILFLMSHQEKILINNILHLNLKL